MYKMLFDALYDVFELLLFSISVLLSVESRMISSCSFNSAAGPGIVLLLGSTLKRLPSPSKEHEKLHDVIWCVRRLGGPCNIRIP